MSDTEYVKGVPNLFQGEVAILRIVLLRKRLAQIRVDKGHHGTSGIEILKE
jgi:hypothetical protein